MIPSCSRAVKHQYLPGKAISLARFPLSIKACTSFLHCVDFPALSQPSKTIRAPLPAMLSRDKSVIKNGGWKWGWLRQTRLDKSVLRNSSALYCNHRPPWRTGSPDLCNQLRAAVPVHAHRLSSCRSNSRHLVTRFSCYT